MITVTATVTAQNTYTSTIKPTNHFGSPKIGHLTLSISGTFAATVTLQRSFDSGSNWVDVETYTAATEKAIIDKTDDIQYRVGVKTGEFSSGTVNLILAK